MSSNWYYLKNGGQIGPCLPDEIRKQIRIGALTPDDHVWKEGEQSWCTIREIHEFYHLFVDETDRFPVLQSEAEKPGAACQNISLIEAANRENKAAKKKKKAAKKKAKENSLEKEKPQLAELVIGLFFLITGILAYIARIDLMGLLGIGILDIALGGGREKIIYQFVAYGSLAFAMLGLILSIKGLVKVIQWKNAE